MSDRHEAARDDERAEYDSATEAHYAAQGIVEDLLLRGHDQFLVAIGLMEMAARTLYAMGCDRSTYRQVADYSYRVGVKLEANARSKLYGSPTDTTLN